MIIICFFLLSLAITFRGPIHRLLVVPKRAPDFEHRLYTYWFDEKIAYSKLAGKKVMRLIDIEGELRERMSRKQQHLMQLFDSNGKLELEVQKAYRDHMAKTFEEVVLGMDEVL